MKRRPAAPLARRRRTARSRSGRARSRSTTRRRSSQCRPQRWPERPGRRANTGSPPCAWRTGRSSSSSRRTTARRERPTIRRREANGARSPSSFGVGRTLERGAALENKDAADLRPDRASIPGRGWSRASAGAKRLHNCAHRRVLLGARPRDSVTLRSRWRRRRRAIQMPSSAAGRRWLCAASCRATPLSPACRRADPRGAWPTRRRLSSQGGAPEPRRRSERFATAPP